MFNELVAANGREPFELLCLREDGTSFSAEFRVKTMQFREKNVSVLGVTDITQRHLMPTTLSTSQQQLQTITDSVPVFISYVDPDHCYQFNNARYEQHFGISRAELKGAHISTVLGDNVYAELKPLLARVFEGNEETHITKVGNKKKSMHVQTIFVPDLRDDGEVAGCFALSTDISDTVYAQVTLKKNEEQLRLLMNQIPIVLWTTDLDLKFTSSVGSGLETLGLESGEVVGMSLYEFFQTEDAEFPPIRAHRLAIEGESQTFDQELEDRMTSRKVRSTWPPTGAT